MYMKHKDYLTFVSPSNLFEDLFKMGFLQLKGQNVHYPVVTSV